MKYIIKHITLAYTLVFILLSSVAIPYSAMTCMVSEQTHWSFLTESKTCASEASCCDINEQHLEKAKCCSYDSGVLDIEASLIQEQIKGFVSFLPEFQFSTPVKIFKADKANPFVALEVFRKEAVPKRIAFQSFLC